MDCHEPDTHFQLVGVFKETDGLEDFAEQLFKHEGYCLWKSDTYDFMSTYREYFPTYCKELYYPDDDGNTLYVDVRPLPEGNVGMGVYTDDICTQLSKASSLQDYIKMFYDANGDAQTGKQIARAWTKSLERFNHHMDVYKTCQPCRAYNLLNGNDNYDEENHSGDGRQRRERFLGNDENDGEGDAEQWGYDCYDDAGYTNCNQVSVNVP